LRLVVAQLEEGRFDAGNKLQLVWDEGDGEEDGDGDEGGEGHFDVSCIGAIEEYSDIWLVDHLWTFASEGEGAAQLEAHEGLRQGVGYCSAARVRCRGARGPPPGGRGGVRQG
jgi:hypothetical protein